MAALTKADKKAFNPIQYQWETSPPLFPGQDENQFQKDFIRSRYSAQQSHIIKSYKYVKLKKHFNAAAYIK